MLREKIAKLNDVLALPELQEVVEKARKWDEAMQQTHYCDDCKAALLSKGNGSQRAYISDYERV